MMNCDWKLWTVDPQASIMVAHIIQHVSGYYNGTFRLEDAVVLQFMYRPELPLERRFQLMAAHRELATKAHLPYTSAKLGRSDLANGVDGTVKDWVRQTSSQPDYIVIPRLNLVYCEGAKTVVFGGLTVEPPPKGATNWGKCFPEFLKTCKVMQAVHSL